MEVISAGPILFSDIEWIELDAKNDTMGDTLNTILDRAKICRRWRGQIVRVCGYLTSEDAGDVVR